MNTAGEIIKRIKASDKAAFFTALLSGLVAHMVALTSDFPNHDGLGSMYFDQNMITSGRWFLGTACSATSYYSLPWLTGILSLVYLSITAALIARVLDVENRLFAGLIGAIAVTFPVIASNYAYVFTMDGYMLGLMLAVLAVYFTKLWKYGFLAGAVCLAFSMGTYQAYISVAMILCIYVCVTILTDKEGSPVRVVRYILMGGIGVALYYVVLRVMLMIQGKVLDTYQGIGDGIAGNVGFAERVIGTYKDFFVFSVKGGVVFQNAASAIATVILVLSFLAALAVRIVKDRLYTKPLFYVSLVAVIVLLPICANAIRFASPGVTYHVLMRYQWAVLVMIAAAVVSRAPLKSMVNVCALALAVLSFSYAVVDNIAYSNLNKKYEKTYAYCVRLLDRIEQTEGYYPGIPIYMIGAVASEQYPTTDITGDVTGPMLSVSGDYLIYRPENYREFFFHYLGASLNIMPISGMEFYYEDWYVAMPSFPAAGSITVRDGSMYIKTENVER